MNKLGIYVFKAIGYIAAIVSVICVGGALLFGFVGRDFGTAAAFSAGAVFSLIFALVFIAGANVSLKRLQQNYNWYKEQYPDKNRNGRPLCHSCNSPKIAVRNLMNHSYMRAHICTVCGTTLYYSPE